MIYRCHDGYTGDLCEVPLTTTTVPTTFTNQPPTITNQPPVSLFPVVAIILGIVIGFLLVLIFFLCCGLVVYTRSRQQHEKLQYKYHPEQYSERVVRNLIAGVESEGVATSTDFSIDDDFSSFSDSYDEVDEVEEEEEEDDANRRMEHLMDVIRNSPYINVSYTKINRMKNSLSYIP